MDFHSVLPVYEIALISGLSSALLTSLIISTFARRHVLRIHKKETKNKFSKAAGNYNCYSFELIDPASSPSDPANHKKTIIPNGGKAVIEYQENNILSITLTEKDGYVWQGKIFMEDEMVGSVVWRYVSLPLSKENEWHWIGLKRLLIREEQLYVYVYLIGEVTDGFDNEVLIRKNM